MSRSFFFVIVILFVLWLVMGRPAPPSAPVMDSAGKAICAGPPLANIEARNDAMEKGYEIIRDYDCISKQSFDAINAQQVAWEQQRAQRVARERGEMAVTGATGFAQARHGFRTAIALHDANPLRLPDPPEHLFVRNDYQNPDNHTLPGFISPDPNDGRRHPAIIWLTGGDSNSLDDFWSPGPDANDQSARAFREAGLIMVFPTLRGGNGSRNAKEYLLGEVDDVLAAADQLTRIRYVDADRIYLGGHSTGGTLALLTAEMKSRFRAVFAFGPVATADRYPPSLIPIDYAQHDALELRLRSPLHWLTDISQPTYVIEGVDGAGNADELERICAEGGNPQLQCIRVHGADHYSAVGRVTRAIAKAISTGTADNRLLRPEDFAR